jgi:hypothetical protein
LTKRISDSLKATWAKAAFKKIETSESETTTESTFDPGSKRVEHASFSDLHLLIEAPRVLCSSAWISEGLAGPGSKPIEGPEQPPTSPAISINPTQYFPDFIFVVSIL